MKPHEEWVDGSWTVDCVCGVRFDDGKEMVNCDECGVWVHTWCSRYVKGDDLFACHKCEIESNKLLAKETLRMESLLDQGRVFTEMIPIEERVHVQGVPGGDLSLFEGFSSVLSRHLWKCSGYVPKKFRFQCREFPCWDDQEDVVGVKDRGRSFGSVGMEMECSHVNKEKSLLCPLIIDKRRREDCVERVKKKVKVEEKEEEEEEEEEEGEYAIGRL